MLNKKQLSEFLKQVKGKKIRWTNWKSESNPLYFIPNGEYDSRINIMFGMTYYSNNVMAKVGWGPGYRAAHI